MGVGDGLGLAARPGVRCWMVSQEETQWGCLYCRLFKGRPFSSFSHIVLISAPLLLPPRCGCVNAVGVVGGRAPPLCVIKGHICVIVPPLPLHPSLPPPRLPISCPVSPPLRFTVSLFFSSRKTLVSGKWWSSCPPLLQPALPSPEPLLHAPALCVFYGCC